MSMDVPDGEYDIDASAVFGSHNDMVFGLRFGFKPDTIDQSYPSYLYSGGSTNSDGMHTVYLESESKENSKAITSNINKHDRIYFEGRKAEPFGVSSSAEHPLNNTNNGAKYSEFLLSFDDISKTFKMSNFDGFIKMNRSRDAEKINDEVSKMKTEVFKHVNRYKTSKIDSIIKTFNKEDSITTTKPISITHSSMLPNVSKSYESSISGISPVRKERQNSPTILRSPTISKGPVKLGPTSNKNMKLGFPNIQSHSHSAPSSKVSSPKLPTKPTTHASSRISSPTRSSATANSRSVSPAIRTNGGIGLQKTGKSSLLRKAERAIGLKNSRISKPASSTPTVTYTTKPIVKSIPKATITTVANKNAILTNLDRDMKQARYDQTAFELTLSPPSPAASTAPVKESDSNKLQKSNKLRESGGFPHKQSIEGIRNNEAGHSSVCKPQSETLSITKGAMDDIKDNEDVDVMELDDDDWAEELEFEMEMEMEMAGGTEEGTTKNSSQGVSASPRNIIETDETDKVSKEVQELQNNVPRLPPSKEQEPTSSPISNEMLGDEEMDYEFDLSDWEEAENNGELMSELDNDTLTKGDFGVIIEENPTKMCLEKEPEKKEIYSSAVNAQDIGAKLGSGANPPVQKPEATGAQIKPLHKARTPAPKPKRKSKPKPKPKSKSVPEPETEHAVTSAPPSATHNSSTSYEPDDSLDLDAELDKAIDMVAKDESDVSEEE